MTIAVRSLLLCRHRFLIPMTRTITKGRGRSQSRHRHKRGNSSGSYTKLVDEAVPAPAFYFVEDIRQDDDFVHPEDENPVDAAVVAAAKEGAAADFFGRRGRPVLYEVTNTTPVHSPSPRRRLSSRKNNHKNINTNNSTTPCPILPCPILPACPKDNRNSRRRSSSRSIFRSTHPRRGTRIDNDDVEEAAFATTMHTTQSRITLPSSAQSTHKSWQPPHHDFPPRSWSWENSNKSKSNKYNFNPRTTTTTTHTYLENARKERVQDKLAAIERRYHHQQQKQKQKQKHRRQVVVSSRSSSSSSGIPRTTTSTELVPASSSSNVPSFFAAGYRHPQWKPSSTTTITHKE